MRAAAGLGLLAMCAQMLAPSARAQPGQSTPPLAGDPLSSVTVTATRLAQPSFDVPASIDSVPIATDDLGINASESLGPVPGLLVRDRHNYAQDEQISIRGFGARAPFGIAGVRIYMDGIPANQPDGQGEISQFNLASAQRIEVLRGPFSVLYGNSAGGVVQLFTAEGNGPLHGQASAVYGSFQERRFSADVQGGDAAFNYNVGVSQFGTAGSRGHSAAQRSSLGGKWGFRFANATRLTVVLNLFNAPDVQDPLGLTLAQFNASPEGTAPSAALFNTRKSVDQEQLGAIFQVPFDATNTLSLMAYGGHRDVLQFLSIPKGAQLAPTSPGAVVSLGNGYGGIEPRWSLHSSLLGGPFDVTAGLTYDVLNGHREGFNNFVGSTLGVQGALRRNEIDEVYDLDQYLQAQWGPIARWTLLAGVRRSAVNFRTTALYVPPGGVNGSGAVDYGATSPVAGVLYALSRSLHLYGSYGDGFETPTFDELAYRPSGAPGLDYSLRASRSHSYELGAKLRLPRVSAQLAVFRADSNDELVLASNSGGRSNYGNAGLTRHQGVELSTDAQLPGGLLFRLAYTYLDARVQTPYYTCSALPCPKPTTLVAAGNALPGLPAHDLYGQLTWRATPRWDWLLTDSYVSRVYANDANSVHAGAYDLLGMATDYTWPWGPGRLRVFVRLDNLLNRRYAGSVIVNNTSSAYFEAGAGRSILAGLSYRFR
jgi:iron complex outermembrane recepter protein